VCVNFSIDGLEGVGKAWYERMQPMATTTWSSPVPTGTMPDIRQSRSTDTEQYTKKFGGLSGFVFVQFPNVHHISTIRIRRPEFGAAYHS
jgi:hypothetical protein